MFERFFGALASDIVGKTDYDFVSRNRPISFAAIPHGDGNRQTLCLRAVDHLCDDGQRACVGNGQSPMFDAQGKLIGVLGMSHDITRRVPPPEKFQRLTQIYER